MKESREDTERYVTRSKFTFPVLRDPDGKVAAQYAPASVLPDLQRADVVIASNLLIDSEGVIRYLSLLDTSTFDAKLVVLKARLEELLSERE